MTSYHGTELQTFSAAGSYVQSTTDALRAALSGESPVDDVVQLVVNLYLVRQWGAANWVAFLEAEGLQIRNLSQDARGPYVRGLQQGGLSLRSIAAVLGISYETVRTDCNKLGVSGKVVGVNGKQYSPLPTWHLVPGQPQKLGSVDEHLDAAEKAIEALQSMNHQPASTEAGTLFQRRLSRIRRSFAMIEQRQPCPAVFRGGTR